ncbi:MAG TPA: AI-2E family transporter [Thermomicrobiales bacterium]|nr:AI-2E family transporter [Thermomicrobiales bacterium]
MATGSPLPSRHRDPDSPVDRPRRVGASLTPVSLFLVLVLFWVLTQTGLVLVLGLMSLLLGTVLEGPVGRLESRRFPRAAAIATVYAALIGAVVLLVLLIVPVVRDQAGEFREQVPGQMRELEQSWSDSSNPLLRGPGRDFLRSGIQFVEQPTSNVSEGTAQRAIPIVTSVGGGLVSTLTVLVITFYYLLEKKLIRRVIIGQLSDKYQPRVDRLWTEVENKVGGWMRGQFVLCLIIGGAATIAYGVIGLSFWPLLGLWAGITEIVPIVGPWLGVIPAIIIALTEGWQSALVTGIFFAGLQASENWFLVPRVMRGAVGLTPLTVFLAILAGTQLMGVAGAVLAIPIAATIQVILTDWLDQRRIENGAAASASSGWRWMLNRSIGREQDTLERAAPPSHDDDEDDHQIVSERDYPGVENPVVQEPVEEEDEVAEDESAATWPGTPWRAKGGDAGQAGSSRGWRGMARTSPATDDDPE